MDNTLLKQLTEQHKRVVIPGFGAFLKKETPGEGEKVVFSPFLRKDDGVVTEAVIREYDVEEEDARAMVAEFTAHLQQTLASAGKYYIEELGTLTTDANGAVTLCLEEAAAEPEEAPEVEPEVEEEEEPQLPPVRPQSIQIQGPSSQPDPAPAPQPVTPPQPERPRPTFGQPAAAGTAPAQPGTFRQPAQPTTPPPASTPPTPTQQRVFSGFPSSRPQPFPQTPPAQRPGAAPRPGSGTTAGPVPGAPAGMQPPQARPPQGSGPVTPPPGARTQPPRRPMPPRRKPVRNKTDIWLIVAIVAALIVIAIMIYGFLTVDSGVDMRDFDTLTPSIETLQDTGSEIVDEIVN